MRNGKAVWSLLVGLLALGALAAGAAAARYVTGVGLWEALLAVPVGFLLALVALSLARRARFEHQRTLGRIGGAGLAAVGRALAFAALVLSVTAALALAVFAVLLVVAD